MKDFARLMPYALLWMFRNESTHCTVLAKKKKTTKTAIKVCSLNDILSLVILIINYVIVLAIIFYIDFTI